MSKPIPYGTTKPIAEWKLLEWKKVENYLTTLLKKEASL